MVTPSIGLAFGIIGYSSTLSQQTLIPELFKNDINYASIQKNNPDHDFIKVPLILATIFASILKCIFAISGAMMMQEQSNLFNDKLFSTHVTEAELMVFCTFLLFIVIPQTVEQMK
jgi:hypothetical protein